MAFDSNLNLGGYGSMYGGYGSNIGQASGVNYGASGYNMYQPQQNSSMFSGVTMGGLAQGVSAGVNLYNAFQSNKIQKENLRLQKESFAFNKENAQKNFDLALDAYSRKIKRLNNVQNEYDRVFRGKDTSEDRVGVNVKAYGNNDKSKKATPVKPVSVKRTNKKFKKKVYGKSNTLNLGGSNNKVMK